MKRNKQLFGLLKGNLRLVAFTIVLAVFHRFTYSYVPLFSQFLIEKLEIYTKGSISGNPTNLPGFIVNFVNRNTDIVNVVFSIGLALIVWQIIRYAALYIENRMRGVISQNVSKNIRMITYDHIQNLSYEYHNNVDSGDLIQRVTSDVDATTHFVTYSFLDVIGLFSSLIFGSYQMFHINKTIMLIILSLLPITMLVSLFFFKKIDRVYKNVEEKESALTVTIQENVSASRVVRAFGNESFEMDKLEVTNSNLKQANISAGKVIAAYWGTMDLVMMIQFVAVLLLGIYFTYQGSMSVSSVSGALMIAGMLIFPIRGLGRIISEYGKALVASDRLAEIMALESEYIVDGSLTPEIKGNIVFKNVSFKFNNDDKYLFRDVSFEIKAGETVAFIGKTGSGKSTLINILLKMYDYEGSILVDGFELREINKQYLRSMMGTVLQDPFLYNKTIFENIRIANSKVASNFVYNAANTAAIDQDIRMFKEGYETLVGEQGVTLSGGQKQRIAIARILVSSKAINIFDDALSALDNKTDLQIRNALKELNHKATNIIITHRMTTAKAANKIVVLSNGMVENIGTHDELVKKEGLYKTLWNIQGAIEEEFKNLVEEAN